MFFFCVYKTFFFFSESWESWARVPARLSCSSSCVFDIGIYYYYCYNIQYKSPKRVFLYISLIQRSFAWCLYMAIPLGLAIQGMFDNLINDFNFVRGILRASYWCIDILFVWRINHNICTLLWQFWCIWPLPEKCNWSIIRTFKYLTWIKKKWNLNSSSF